LTGLYILVNIFSNIQVLSCRKRLRAFRENLCHQIFWGRLTLINVINQKLGYLVRCGNPDAMDSIVPMAYGNLALDLISKGMHGRLVILRNGRYDNAPIDIVTSSKKLVDINKFYNTDRLRPQYNSFEFMPQMIL